MSEIASVRIPSEVNPDKLIALLVDAGWRAAGGRRGIYTRFSPPETDDRAAAAASLVIPLNSSAPDFEDSLQAALIRLSENKDLWNRSIYPRLAVNATDEFRFRKESNAPSGLIQWRNGERLIESARRTLLAGAKSFMGPGRHFVNRHSGFASRYLDQVLMGQTAPGSYIVTAYAPSEAKISLRGGVNAPKALIEASAAQVRAVNESVVRAVEATAEALLHYKANGSLAGFEDGVSRGISYEMTNAILGIATGAEESDISIEWSSDTPPPAGVENKFVFHNSDVEPLSRAAVKLAEDDTSQIVSVMGRVHLLAKKQAGSPGVFGIDSLQSAGPRKVRVRLADEEDYHEAVRAHEEDLALRVTGRLEKEGNLSWLYDATVVQTLGHVEEYSLKRPRHEEVPGQMEIFEESSPPSGEAS